MAKKEKLINFSVGQFVVNAVALGLLVNEFGWRQGAAILTVIFGIAFVLLILIALINRLWDAGSDE